MQQFGLQQFGLLTQRTQGCGAMAAVAALAVARAASARVLALQPTVEQQREEIERVQRRAEEVGMVEKTAGESGVAGSMQRGWQKWISSALGAQAAAHVEAGEAPTLADQFG